MDLWGRWSVYGHPWVTVALWGWWSYLGYGVMGGDRQGSMGSVVLLWSSSGHCGPVGLVVLYGAHGDGWRPPRTYGVGGPLVVFFESLRPYGIGGPLWGTW